MTLSSLRVWLRSVLRRASDEREMDEELQFHIDMLAEKHVRAGMPPDASRRAALVTFGGRERYKEEVRDERGGAWLEDLVRDMRFALRGLRRESGFAASVVLTLALGIGASAAIFALVDGVLLRPLPYSDAERLVSVRHSAPGLGIADVGQSTGTYLHYREHNRVFEGMGVYFERSQTLTDRDEAERIRSAMVTPDLVSLLGVVPHRGRLFTWDDAVPGSPYVVMISHRLWVRRYGADPAIVGGTVVINRGQPTVVVGVMPPGFDFPSADTDLWWGMGASATRANLQNMFMGGIAKLKPDVSAREAEADLQRLLPGLAESYGDVTPATLQESQLQASVTPLRDALVADVRPLLLMLLATAAFVLVIAFANVTNLFLVRAERRRRSVAVQRALGAGDWHLARRFLCESLVLATLGGALALLIAYAGVRSHFGFEPGQVPRLHEIHLDSTVVAVTLGLSLLSAAMLGVVSLARSGHTGRTSALNGTLGRLTTNREEQGVQRVLVGAQVALALTLLIGSAVMAQSVWRLSKVDLGFDPRGVLTFSPPLPVSVYQSYHDAARFHLELLERLRAVPGVEEAEAGADNTFPLVAPPPFDADRTLAVEGRPVGAHDAPTGAAVGIATSGYFSAMRIPLLRGRTFEPGDLAGESPSVILSEALAHSLFGGEDPIGRRVRFTEAPSEPAYTVIGVAGSVPGESIPDGPARALYFPLLHWADAAANPGLPVIPREPMIVLRTSLPPASLVPAVRRVVHEMDAKVPLVNVRTMEQIVDASTARPRLTALLLLVAAGTALALGVIGIYGVISYAVSMRTSEFGVRLAMGATPAAVHRLVLRQGALVLLAGIAVGIAAALASMRLLRGLLYEVSPNDPITFAAMAVLLFTVAVVASYLPARRAGRTDPAIALRGE